MINNPLLEPSTAPHHAVRFDLLRPEHFLPGLEQAITDAQNRINEIIKSNAPPSMSLVIEGLEQATEKVEWISAIFFNLFGAETSPDLQKLAQEIGPRLARFSSDIILNVPLFEKVRAVYDSRENLSLTPEQSRLLDNTYSEFVRNGALLDETQKKRLREIDERLSQLGPQFSENVLKATNAFELYLKTPEEIAGLPSDVVEAARHAAEAKGRPTEYLFTLQMPSYLPALKFADHRPTRERLVKAAGSRAFRDAHDNQGIILELVRLRYERAHLLGYKTHAHFVLEKRMAETPERVRQFLDELLEPSRSAALRELEEVQALSTRLGGPRPLQAWDFAYYAEKLKEEKFKFNDEDLRPYFQLEKVIDGAFLVSSRLFDLEFKATTEYPVYHPDVRVFEVYQNRDGAKTFMGLFYADFFPRATKRDGAWMTNYYEQVGSRRPHVAIVCNFTKSTPSKPSLLSLSEVQTLFHEFGHSLHSLLSRCQYRSLGGTNVYWDFVELPSQLMENWVQEKSALDLFARHYKTGEIIPAELVEKLRSSRQFLAGFQSLRQLSLGYLDLAWYAADPTTVKDVEAHELGATAATTILPRVPGNNQSCGFGHIFGGGYSAGYYSYKWAEVLDADAFEFFIDQGIFNREVARRLEDNVLSKGGSRHPAELYRNFRGREPDAKALLRRDGLV
jgi:peptidyl-dipeptidase Dcp